MAPQTRFQKSFKNKVMSCEYRGGTFWLGVMGSGETIYNVSVKIGDDCGWSGVQGIPKGILCSHEITALRYLISKSVVEGMLGDKKEGGRVWTDSSEHQSHQQ